jgi:hypothetical protein
VDVSGPGATSLFSDTNLDINGGNRGCRVTGGTTNGQNGAASNKRVRVGFAILRPVHVVSFSDSASTYHQGQTRRWLHQRAPFAYP